jgi:hypothetical protein
MKLTTDRDTRAQGRFQRVVTARFLVVVSSRRVSNSTAARLTASISPFQRTNLVPGFGNEVFEVKPHCWIRRYRVFDEQEFQFLGLGKAAVAVIYAGCVISGSRA